MKCQSKWNQQNAISNMSIGRHNEWNFVQEKIKKATQKKECTTAYPIFLNPFRFTLEDTKIGCNGICNLNS